MVWLWASQHCTLEAAGLLDHTPLAAACASQGDDHCGADNCDAVENGALRTTDASVQVAAPDAICPDCWLCLALLAPQGIPPVCFATAHAEDRAPQWVPAWHFARRTVQPSRAPSLILLT